MKFRSDFLKFIILVINFFVVSGEDQLLLIKKEKKFFCITNSTYGLAWINEENSANDESQSVSRFASNKNKDQIDWNITKNKRYYSEGKWTVKNAEEVDNVVVLDRRWEEMKIYNTELLTNEKTNNGVALKFIPVMSDLQTNFIIPFSVRIQQDAHILLCDTTYVTASNCYWFLLQAFNGAKSVFRKCGKSEISDINGKSPQGSCSRSMKEIQHPKDMASYLSSDHWTHFKIIKNKHQLKLNLISGNIENTILEYTDTDEEKIAAKHMLIHSKQYNGLWKIHYLRYIYTQEERKDLKLGPILSVVNGSICISMFVSMCASCQLTLGLAEEKNRNIKLNEQTYEEMSGWQEIKFISQHVQDVDAVLLISLSNSGPEKPYWAIDKVRTCASDEFRLIETGKYQKCQLINSENNTISLTQIEAQSTIGKTGNECPSNTIGRFCIPCRSILNPECGALKVCEKLEAANKCSCSSGYSPIADCKSECRGGRYGHGCQKNCGKCLGGSCDHINGKCDNCTDDYSGPRCSIRPLAPCTNAVEVQNVSYTRVYIVKNVDSVDNIIYDQESTFKIQYKKSEGKVWSPLEMSHKFDKKEAVVQINDLTPNTKYVFRCLITGNGKTPTDESISTKEFETQCHAVTVEHLDIQTFSTSVNVELNDQVQKTHLCPFYKSLVQIVPLAKGKSARKIKLDYNKLEPCTEYGLRYNFTEKKFTTQGIPDRVFGLSFVKTSPSSLTLEWQAPQNIQGELLHYVVEYKFIKYQACNAQPSDTERSESLTVTQTSITIENLIPYSSYSFSVFVVNDKCPGPPVTAFQTTKASDVINDEEIPQIMAVTPDAYKSTIKLSKIDCSKVQGSLVVHLTAKCSGSWCTDKATRIVSYDQSKQSITLNNLKPFSNYSVELRFCRNTESCSINVQERSFQTKPVTPHSVNPLAYSKNENSISLRWKPPYPPTGTLELYNIVYRYSEDVNIRENETNKTVEIQACKLWPTYHCVTLEDLVEDKTYQIMIWAKNKELNGLGQQAYTEVTTQTESSESPYDLNIFWSLNNDLTLKWKHPNKTNGDIRFFNISVFIPSGALYSNNLSIFKEDYKFQYIHALTTQYFHPSIMYTVRIRAYNGREGDEIVGIKISPPDIPLLKADPEISRTNDSIDVKIPHIHGNLTKEVKLFLFVSDENVTNATHPELQQFKKSFQLNFSKFRLVYECSTQNFNNTHFAIGKSALVPDCREKQNPPLNTEYSYNVTILLTNTFQTQSRYKLYSFASNSDYNNLQEIGEQFNYSLLGFLALLLIIPVAILVYFKRNSLHSRYSSMKTNLFGVNNPDIEAAEDQIPLNKQVTVHSKVIKTADLESYVRKTLEGGELERQHALFPRGQTKPWAYGELKANRNKNRYTNLIAYDHTRVVLEKINGKEHSDYINANYIDGYKIPKAYIATQGPKMSTTNDFWRMIWQENVKHIIMLANLFEGGKKKVEKYWPEMNESLPFEDIEVQHVSTTVFTDYEHRTLKVICGQQTRQLDQYHFMSWPDHGVPIYSQSLVSFVQSVQKLQPSSSSPIVVHCSAGVGRTGTIVLVDICLRMAAAEGTVDILNRLQTLRDQRPNMVDNVQQYKLVHLVVLECLFGENTAISCATIEQEVKVLLKNGKIKAQVRRLEETAWKDDVMKSVSKKKENWVVVKEKNRFQDIVPEPQGSIYISRYPVSDNNSNYLNAVVVDGFRSPGQFIVTQQPMPNTVGDFWRLIDEKDISLVVSLNEVDLSNQNSCSFWPSELESHPVDYLTVKQVDTTSLQRYTVVTLQLQRGQEEHKNVEILCMNNWPANSKCPPKIEDFLTFWQDSTAKSRQSKQVVVTCFDGALASGIYVAMSFVIEKMKLEQVCDVCQAVRSIRHNRKQFVREEEQFRFLYEAAVSYINGFQSYANFN